MSPTGSLDWQILEDDDEPVKALPVENEPVRKKYCKSCGFELDGDFCPQCGCNGT